MKTGDAPFHKNVEGTKNLPKQSFDEVTNYMPRRAPAPTQSLERLEREHKEFLGRVQRAWNKK